MITVVIPVGPNPKYMEWLPAAVNSVLDQTLKCHLLIIDDGADFTQETLKPIFGDIYGYTRNAEGFITYLTDSINFGAYRTPCRVGVADAFNFGVALAPTECVFMMGSDDILKPTCLEHCWDAYQANDSKDAWYNVTVSLERGGVQDIPNHAAMVTKGLFNWFAKGSGYFGFPPSAGVGGPDALLLSILMKQAPDKIVQVKQGTPLYWVREHEHQMTLRDAAFFHEEVISIRNKETERFNVR